MGVEGKTRRASAWLLVVISLIVALCGVGVWGASNAFAEDKSINNLSFARLTSAASAYFDWATNPASNDSPNLPDGGLSLGQAGTMVGYQDKDWDLLEILNWNISELTSGAQGRGYTGKAEGYHSIHQAVEQYMAYGFSLNSLGLDSTANQTFDIMLVARAISGIPVLIGYIASLSVDVVFALIIWLLLFLNPFSWFLGPASVIDSHGMGSYMNAARNNDPLGLFIGIRDTVTDLYNMMDEMAWSVIVPVFFGITVISIIMFSSARKQAGTKFRKLITYVLFIIIGIPLLGGTYTYALSMMGQTFGLDTETHALKFEPKGTMDGTYVIASTFCDFEGWAAKTNLKWPSGCEVDVTVQDNNTPYVSSNTPVRTLCRKINSEAGLSGLNEGSADGDKWNNATYSVNGSLDFSSQNNIGTIFEMLLRYMGGSFYTASDYETSVKAHLTGNTSLTEDMKKYNDYKNWNENDPWKSSMDVLMGPNSITASGSRISGYLNAIGSLEGPNDSVLINSSGSLTTLSTYNYLRTTFEGSSVNVFQPEKAVNMGSNPAHRSVNLIGSGLMCPLYWLNSIVMLYVLTIIGWAYAMPILFSNIRRSIQMVISVPFAMIGMLKSAARVVTLTLMMILEVLVTMFAYQLVKVLLMSMNNVIEIYAAQALQSAWGTVSALMVVVSPLTIVIGILINIWFCVMAVRLRKMLVKSIDEMMASAVNRLFAADGGMPGASSKPGLVKSAAGAAGAGAMMMAGNAGANMFSDKVGKTELGQKMGIGKSKDSATTTEGGKQVGDLPGGGAIEGGAAQKIPGLDGPQGGGGGALPVGDSQDSVDKGQGKPDTKSPASQDGISGQSGRQSSNMDDIEYLANGVEAVSSNNAVRNTSFTSGQASSKSTRPSKKDAREAKAENKLNTVTGKVDAVSAESNAETANKMKHKQRREAVKDSTIGAVKAGVGAAEAYAGAQTGNAKLAQRGVANLSDGASKMGAANDKMVHAKNDSKVAVAQASNASVKGGGDGTAGKTGQQKMQEDSARKIQAQHEATRVDRSVDVAERNAAKNEQTNKEETQQQNRVSTDSDMHERADTRSALNADMASKPDMHASAMREVSGVTDAKTSSGDSNRAQAAVSQSSGANAQNVTKQSVSSTTNASASQSTTIGGDKSVSSGDVSTSVSNEGGVKADVSQKQNVAQSNVNSASSKQSSVTQQATKVDASKKNNVVATSDSAKRAAASAVSKAGSAQGASAIKSTQSSMASKPAGVRASQAVVPQHSQNTQGSVQRPAQVQQKQQPQKVSQQQRVIQQSTPKQQSVARPVQQSQSTTPGRGIQNASANVGNDKVKKRKLSDDGKSSIDDAI